MNHHYEIFHLRQSDLTGLILQIHSRTSSILAKHKKMKASLGATPSNNHQQQREQFDEDLNPNRLQSTGSSQSMFSSIKMHHHQQNDKKIGSEQTPSTLNVIVSSALSGCIARLALHPLDTVKARMYVN